jgi:hypothetical protein
VIVHKIVAARWTVYKLQLAQRKTVIAAAQRRQSRLNAAAAGARAPVATIGASGSQSPTVRIVNLPPLTVTRTS